MVQKNYFHQHINNIVECYKRDFYTTSDVFTLTKSNQLKLLSSNVTAFQMKSNEVYFLNFPIAFYYFKKNNIKF